MMALEVFWIDRGLFINLNKIYFECLLFAGRYRD